MTAASQGASRRYPLQSACEAGLFGVLRGSPSIIRHYPVHEFIEQWNCERRIPVTRAPDHSFLPGSLAISPERWGPGPSSVMDR